MTLALYRMDQILASDRNFAAGCAYCCLEELSKLRKAGETGVKSLCKSSEKGIHERK